MFALSPLVSHLIPDSHLPPLHAGLSGTVLVGIAKEPEKGEQLNTISQTCGPWKGVFEVGRLSPCFQGTLICLDCMIFLQVCAEEVCKEPLNDRKPMPISSQA